VIYCPNANFKYLISNSEVISMRTLIIYDSVYGNTEKIAQSICSALGPGEEIGLIRAGEATIGQLSGLNILVVGSPTQRFMATHAINELFKIIPRNSLKGVKVAAFDTRLSLSDIESSVERFAVKVGGYAAKGIANRLKKCGGILIVPPEGFIVKGMEGPLMEGELERAADWANQIKSLSDRG
jgi:flavodoxin